MPRAKQVDRDLQRAGGWTSLLPGGALQPEAEGRAAPRRTLHLQLATVSLQDALGHREAQPPTSVRLLRVASLRRKGSKILSSQRMDSRAWHGSPWAHGAFGSTRVHPPPGGRLTQPERGLGMSPRPRPVPIRAERVAPACQHALSSPMARSSLKSSSVRTGIWDGAVVSANQFATWARRKGSELRCMRWRLPST